MFPTTKHFWTKCLRSKNNFRRPRRFWTCRKSKLTSILIRTVLLQFSRSRDRNPWDKNPQLSKRYGGFRPNNASLSTMTFMASLWWLTNSLVLEEIQGLKMKTHLRISSPKTLFRCRIKNPKSLTLMLLFQKLAWKRSFQSRSRNHRLARSFRKKRRLKHTSCSESLQECLKYRLLSPPSLRTTLVSHMIRNPLTCPYLKRTNFSATSKSQSGTIHTLPISQFLLTQISSQ